MHSIKPSLVRDLTLFGLIFLSGLAQSFADEPRQWQVYDGFSPEGYGRHLVFISGDEEYRSEEALTQLAKIMAVRQGFKCTVLYAQSPDQPGIVNPQVLDNIPGLEALRTADLMVIFTRFRALPDDQMKEIEAYLNSGRPVVGLRTANHGFLFPEDSKWHRWSWKYHGNNEAWNEGFGGLVLGSWFFSHHGWHGHESTRGVIEKGAEKHEILRGIEPGSVWGATDVYGVKEPIPGEDMQVLLRGEVLEGMEPDSKPLGKGPYEKAPEYVTQGSNDKNDPMQALAWTKSYQLPGGREGRVFTTTMGASVDLQSEGTRRLIANGILWCLGMDIPAKTDVALVGDYQP
ncbi:MAG: ThuA domain-containing protein, partial [Verrucomicrobiae bacterium]|nr:ThuA domain-containing protein [Verrucomicrobiae bacterium]